MLSALNWVSSSTVKSVPAKFEPNEEEIKNLKTKLKLQLNDQEDEEMEDEDPIKKSKKSNSSSKKENYEEFDEFNMENYDEEEDNAVIIPAPEDAIFEETLENFDDEDDSDLEDLIIKKSDNIIIGVHSEEEETNQSHLDMYIYEEMDENLYVHHDIPLSQFPLCLSWLGFHPKEEGNKGNLVAVGTFDPEIHIWDLDVLNVLDPVCTLGGKKKEEKKKKKNKNTKTIPNFLPGSHTSAVMGLDWNKIETKFLASCSADTSVKVWDISTQQCVATYDHHRDKVQSVIWKLDQPNILLTGSYDKTITLFDGREEQYKQAQYKQFYWKTVADCEGLQWTHDPNYFMVSLENGSIIYCDIRVPLKYVWTLAAHNKTVSGISYNPQVPNFFATGSIDKTVKLWVIENGNPKCLHITNMTFPVFSLSFCNDSPFLLAAGGKGDSEKFGGDPLERLTVIKTYEYFSVQKHFPQCIPKKNQTE